MAKALTGFEINLPGMAAGKKLLRKLHLKRSKSDKHPGAVAAEQAELAARFKFKSGGGVVTATAGGEAQADEEEGGGRAGPDGQLVLQQQEEEFVTASDTAGDAAGDARGSSGRAGMRGRHRRRRNHDSSSSTSNPAGGHTHTHSTDSSSSTSSGSSSSGSRSSRGSASGVTQAAPAAPAHPDRVTPFAQGSSTLHLSELEAAALSAAPGQMLVNANGQLVSPVYRGDSALDMA
jgi:hypothetical protein